MSIRDGCIFLFNLLLWTSCTNLGPSARYYYPIDELEDGLVYAYEGSIDGGFAPYYWFYRSVETPDSTVLTGTYYSYEFEPLQFTNERIVADGSLRRALRLYSPTDSISTQTVATVLEPALFSFLEPDPDRLLVSAVRFSSGPDSSGNPGAIYTITHNRHYLKDTSITLFGKTYAAQAWEVRELIEQDSVGVLSVENQALEIYAEGVGLAYRERIFSNGTLEAYRLTGRFSMDSLERMAGYPAATFEVLPKG